MCPTRGRWVTLVNIEPKLIKTWGKYKYWSCSSTNQSGKRNIMLLIHNDHYSVYWAYERDGQFTVYSTFIWHLCMTPSLLSEGLSLESEVGGLNPGSWALKVKKKWGTLRLTSEISAVTQLNLELDLVWNDFKKSVGEKLRGKTWSNKWQQTSMLTAFRNWG